MFLDNKYTTWYFKIVEKSKNENRCKNTGKYESHHIIPKSLGGDNSKENLVFLTPREHFILHCLLVKMTIGLEKRKMSLALYRMKQSNSNYCRIGNGKLYEKLKLNISHLFSGSNNYFHHNKYFGKNNVMSNPIIKQKHLIIMQDSERRLKISENSKGELNPFYGKKHSIETKTKLSEIAKKRIGENSPMYGKKHKLAICEKCNKQITYPMYKRWHGENCKVN